MPYDIPLSLEGEQIQATEYMRIALVGPSGIGKSWMCATAPKPWFFDFDGRINSLAGKPITGKTYYDTNPQSPMGWLNATSDLAQFEYLASQGKDIPETFVCDSMQMMCQAAMNYNMFSNKNLRRELQIGAAKAWMPNSFDAWEAERQAVQGFVSRLFALGNVICNFHETPEEAPGSTQERPIYTGKVAVFPARMNKILPLFNEKWRLSNENGTRTVFTNIKDYKFNAASTLLLDDTEEPDIAKMFAKHADRVKK